MPNIHPSARAPRDATGSNSDKAYCQEGELDNEISVGRGEGVLFIFSFAELAQLEDIRTALQKNDCQWTSR